jgi:hypothetical protein
LDKYWNNYEKILEKLWKSLGKLWESLGKILEKSVSQHKRGKILKKPWENLETRENLGETLIKTLFKLGEILGKFSGKPPRTLGKT